MNDETQSPVEVFFQKANRAFFASIVWLYPGFVLGGLFVPSRGLTMSSALAAALLPALMVAVVIAIVTGVAGVIRAWPDRG